MFLLVISLLTLKDPSISESFVRMIFIFFDSTQTRSTSIQCASSTFQITIYVQVLCSIANDITKTLFNVSATLWWSVTISLFSLTIIDSLRKTFSEKRGLTIFQNFLLLETVLLFIWHFFPQY